MSSTFHIPQFASHLHFQNGVQKVVSFEGRFYSQQVQKIYAQLLVKAVLRLLTAMKRHTEEYSNTWIQTP